MKFKRPIKFILIALILGIVIAYSNISFTTKFILISISFFLLIKKSLKKDIDYKLILCIVLSFLIGVLRFIFVNNYYDNITKIIEEKNKKEYEFTGEIINIGESTNSFYYDLKNVDLYGHNINKVRLYFNKENDEIYSIGNILNVNAKIYTINEPMNFGEFNSLNYYRSMGLSFTSYAKNINVINDKKNIIRQNIYEIKNIIKENIFKIFNEEDAGVILLMLTGDKSKIDKAIKKLFSDNGISHILAISGLHLSILGLMLFEILRRKFSIKTSGLIVSIFIFLYGIMIDASPTSLRAIIMLYIRFLSLFLGRSYDSKNTLYILCLSSLLIRPYLLFNAGFLFSYVAVYALNQKFVIYDEKKEEYEIIKRDNKKIINENIDNKNKIDLYNIKFKKIIIPPLIILNLLIFPITIYNYFDYPVYSILLNLIVIPLMTIVLLFSIVGIVISFLSIPAAKISVLIVHYILMLYKYLCSIISSLPFNTINFGKPSEIKILLYYAGVVLIYFICKKTKNKNKIDYTNLKKYKKNIIINKTLKISLIVIISLITIFIHKKYDFKMSFISVGQGDGIFIENDNQILSIDGGSTSNSNLSEYILTPNLKARQIDVINHAFITHADSDHTNGMIDIINNDDIKIENMYLPIFAKENLKYKYIIDACNEKNINIYYLKSGERLLLDDIGIYVLNPIENDEFEKKDINEQSLTFILKYKNLKTMFTGDIGKTAEAKILKNNESTNIDVDILKVAHHGSRNSSLEEFIGRVKPEISIVSSGKNNQYNHPHKETIDTLNKYNSKILLTKESGEIDIILEDGKLEVYEFLIKK